MHFIHDGAELLTGIDLNLLKVFDALMKDRSVTLAAKRLGRTQSAVSHALGNLRVLFKDRLFTRDGGTMRPTPRALELAADIVDALETIAATIDRYQTFEPLQTARNFRIGLLDYHGAMVVPDLLALFRKQAPNATLNIVPTSKEEVGRLVLSRKIDCAVIPNFETREPALHLEEVGRDELFCAVWSGSSLAEGDLTLDRYLKVPHIQISADGQSEGLADKALRTAGLTRRIAATIPNYLMIPWVLRQTDYLVHCADSILLLMNETSEVRFVKPPIALPSMPIFLIVHNQLLADPATAWIRKVIADIYRQRDDRKRRAWMAEGVSSS